MMDVKFGLKGPKVDHLNRTLRVKNFLLDELNYPEACNLTEGLVPDEDDLGNRSIGLCGLAAPAHKVRWADQLNKRTPRVDTDGVVQEYQNFGYVPGDETTDNGVYGLDVFKRWRKEGLFGLPPIAAFAQVDYSDDEEIAASTFLFGGIFLCLSLPKRCAAGDPRDVDIWDAPPDGNYGGELGGHMVWLHGSSCNSWGLDITVTRDFIAQRTYDAFVTFGADDLVPGGRAFSGLDVVGMLAALKAVTL